MSKSLKYRAILVLLAAVLGLYFLSPTLSKLTGSGKTDGEGELRLGLDLQGGLHLVLEVQSDKAISNTVDRITDDLKEQLREERIRVRNLTANDKTITLSVRSDEGADKVEKLLADQYGALTVISRQEAGSDGVMMALGLIPEEEQAIKDYAVSQGIETIRNRIDQFGVAEPVIVPQGQREILIQLPGIGDEESKRAKNLIGQTAQLEFRLLEETYSVDQALQTGAPKGTEIVYEIQQDPYTGDVISRTPHLVQDRVLLTGDVIRQARVMIDQRYNEPYVSLEFDSKGAKLFGRVTGANVNKRLAIVLDGVLQSAPVIREKIEGGNAQISGRFTPEEARDLTIALRSGSLPAPVEVLNEIKVGPSLGSDSIRAGFMSLMVGGLLVVLFMAIYYKTAGVIADSALILNVVLIMGALAAFQATLTMPGIAGIVLTVGMAVDANVLIFERIREELRQGKSPLNAVQSGYAKAFSTILDANVTTFIAAAVLWQYGTGPIKGFAVTLAIGIIASMFTSIVGTRVVFDMILSRKSLKRLSI